MNESEPFLPIIDHNRCNGCGECVRVCTSGALELRERLAMLVLPDGCTYCANCEDHCPTHAINLPYEITLDTVTLKDKVYVS